MPDRKKAILLLGLTLAIAAGIALRLVWGTDIEYKYDQQYLFEKTQTVGKTEPWPELGMVSGPKLKNPAMSIWVFVALSKIYPVSEPVDLARITELTNIAAILLLIFVACKIVPRKEQEPWLWAAALVAVNPIAIIYHRIIWSQSVLPLFLSILWIGWFTRNRKFGAAIWGLASSCLGQIHLSGFFFSLALGLGTFAADKANKQKTSWPAFAAAFTLGSLPLIPWIIYLAQQGGATSVEGFNWIEPLKLKFWAFWIGDALGFHVAWNLGIQLFYEFLQFPTINGHPTYLVSLIHLGMAYFGARCLFKMIRVTRWKKDLILQSPTRLAVVSIFVLMGILLTLSGVPVYRHYLIVAFPLEWVSVALVCLAGSVQAQTQGRRWLAALCVLNCALSISYLSFIREHGGAPTGPYGISLRIQQ